MNILSFDIEDWYNCDFISEDFDWGKWEYRVDKALLPLLDELDRRGLKGTFFCLGWLAEKHPDIIREADEPVTVIHQARIRTETIRHILPEGICLQRTSIIVYKMKCNDSCLHPIYLTI